ncbi:MAG: hypothetical protein ABH854_04635 [Candidatus Diapherotrites archaeon]|nr:hypothetical protein [Candidatus Micrarchaeota archaeon]
MGMDARGQIFTLDLVLSMILVVLAFGLALNFMELNQYALQEQEIRAELRTLGDAAADALVSAPGIVCDLGYYTDAAKQNWVSITHLPNCIMEHNVWPKGTLDRHLLGLGARIGGEDIYACHISFEPAFGSGDRTIAIRSDAEGGCHSGTLLPNLSGKYYYSVRRRIVIPKVSTASISDSEPEKKSRLEKSQWSQIANGDVIYVTLTVWRRDL